MHAVDRLAGPHMLMPRLQHQSIAPQRHHPVALIGIVTAVERCQLRQRLLGFRNGARHEGDPVVALGAGHGDRGLDWGVEGSGVARKVVYTTQAVLVEKAAGGTSPDRAMSVNRKPAMSARLLNNTRPWPFRAKSGLDPDNPACMVDAAVSGGPGERDEMRLCTAALIALTVIAGARAEDAPPPAQSA